MFNNIVIKQVDPTDQLSPSDSAEKKLDQGIHNESKERSLEHMEETKANFNQYELLNMIVQNQEIQIQDMKNRNASQRYAQMQHSNLQPIYQAKISTRRQSKKR